MTFKDFLENCKGKTKKQIIKYLKHLKGDKND